MERVSELLWRLKEIYALYKDVIDGTLVMDYESLVNLLREEIFTLEELEKISGTSNNLR